MVPEMIDTEECCLCTHKNRFRPSGATECEDPWNAAEFGSSEEFMKTIGVIVKVHSTSNMSVDASDITDSVMNEAASDDVRELKRRLEEMEKENRRLKQLSEKRQKRAPKKTDKGDGFKSLKDIPVEDQLENHRLYPVSKFITTNLFRNMKYFVEAYKKTALTNACRQLGFDEKAESKYNDFLVNYIDKKTSANRNNIIHKLKTLFLGLDGDQLELPKEYKSWKHAIGDFVEARGQNKTPDQLEAHTWKAFETFALKLVPKVTVHYSQERDRSRNKYHKAVTPSDEAFVWQVMTFYPSSWVQERDQGDNDSVVDNSSEVSISVSSNGTKSVKVGPKGGFTETAGKTMLTYEAYVRKMGESRQALNANKWSERLLLVARQIAYRNRKAAESTAAPPVMTIAPRDLSDLLLYAPVHCDFPEDMKADDADEFEGTEGAAMVPV